MAKKQATISDQVKAAIANADISMCRIARESGIDVATLSRFMHGKGGLSTEGLDKIGAILGLQIVAKPQTKGK